MRSRISVCPTVHSSSRPFIHLSVDLSVRPSIRPSVRPSVCLSVDHTWVEFLRLRSGISRLNLNKTTSGTNNQMATWKLAPCRRRPSVPWRLLGPERDEHTRRQSWVLLELSGNSSTLTLQQLMNAATFSLGERERERRNREKKRKEMMEGGKEGRKKGRNKGKKKGKKRKKSIKASRVGKKLERKTVDSVNWQSHNGQNFYEINV